MPLIHSKRPTALSKNIATEVRAGKPVKEAAAIAYSIQRRAEHKKSHGGAIEDCPMCNGGKADLDEQSRLNMADGGEVGEVQSSREEDEAQDRELMDDEIHNMLGEEIMAAIDSKDKKRIMESMEALILSCVNKE